jgi:hypothetical protein
MPASRADRKLACLACGTNDDGALRELLSKGLPPDTQEKFAVKVVVNGRVGHTPEAVLPLLHISCMSVSTECVALLLGARADPCVKINYPSAATALDCCFTFQRQLPDRPGWPAMDCARLVILARADPNTQLYVFGSNP